MTATHFDEPHITQTIAGRQFKTTPGGTVTSRLIGVAITELCVLEDTGWWFLPRIEVHIDDNVVVPDLAGWRREQMLSLSRASASSRCSGAPIAAGRC